MSSEPELFEPKRYAMRIMQSKGYFAKKTPNGYIDTDADVMAVFQLQMPSWQFLFTKHNLAANVERSEQILLSFGHREVMGGPNKVLETFAQHLDAQPKQGGSPDWSQAGREWAECGWCDGRGVVSAIPVRVQIHGEIEEREYSFACKCDRGRFFAGMRVADDWMIQYAADRKTAEIARHKDVLRRFGIDPEANQATRNRQYRAAIRSMVEQVGSGRATARTVRPFLPKTVEEAKAMLAGTNAGRHMEPPPELDPENLALAVYDNGDERGDW